MKKFFLSLFVATLLGFNPAYCQFSFGVSPGLGFNSAYFGYKMNKFVPSIGFQYAGYAMNLEETGKRYDFSMGQIVSYTNKSSMSVNLVVPNIGAKYFIAQQNKVQAYLSLNISKPILSGKMKEDNVTSEFGENIKKVKLWGGELGFGMEYFFDENFMV
ncbi:MAG: hypothetical protein AUJ97_09205 [Bacteroidetes bacterium CG2_30_32_10]|nr:MAG: hypothetical protein AUJ97_09205 [Bacteroidetes bacterium CG2_30_32_10]